jgi:hypothetical protein
LRHQNTEQAVDILTAEDELLSEFPPSSKDPMRFMGFFWSCMYESRFRLSSSCGLDSGVEEGDDD